MSNALQWFPPIPIACRLATDAHLQPVRHDNEIIQRTNMSRKHRHIIYRSTIAILPVLAALLWLLVAAPTPTGAVSPHQVVDPARAPSTLLIGTVPGASQAEIAALLAQEGLRIERVWPALNLVEARLDGPTATSDAALAATATAQATLAGSPLLRYIIYDAQVEIAALPTDPRIAEQWAFNATHAAEGWNITRGDARVTIALLDTGFAMNHEDLSLSRLWVNEAEANGEPGIDDDNNGYIDDINGWDWIDEDAVADDEHGHGTHIGGIIAASTNNDIGIAGHGQQLRIAPLRILGSTGTGFTSDLVDALDYARAQGFPIINLSLTVACGEDECPALHDAIKAAHAAGSMVVAATGNKGGGVHWPGLYPETVAVAATTSDDTRWTFSNYGPSVDLAAPGAYVLSTYIDYPLCATPCTTYSTQTGTSMATPHVAALAGLILSVRPDFTLTDTLALMKATAADLNADTYPGTDIYLGAGAIDYRAALITASMPLSLTSLAPSPLVVQAGSYLQLPMHVELERPGGRWDIAGAVVSYTVAYTDGTPVTQPAAVATDISGTAQLSLTVPISPGTYLVTGQAGMATQSVSLTVRSVPLTTTLAAATLTTTVGAPGVPFTVTIDTPNEVISDVVLPLHLTTTLGTFADGKTEKTVYLSEKIYTDTLMPGTTPGSAALTASIGTAHDAVTVAVLPGEPAQLYSPLGNEPPLIIASEETFLSFEVADAYDNPVADGTTVVITTNVGTVEPTETSTQNGIAVTKLKIPADAPGPVVITATVPTANLVYRLEIPLIQDLYIPLLRTAPAQ